MARVTPSFIGVTEGPVGEEALKKYTFLFDQIAYIRAREIIDDLRDPEIEVPVRNKLAALTESLLDKGVLFEPKWASSRVVSTHPEFVKAKSEWERLTVEFPKRPTLSELYRHVGSIHSASSRMMSVQLRLLDGLDAYPVWAPESAGEGKSNVIKVVLRALPLPDRFTPLEQILEYKDDPDSRHKFLALRTWMSDIARSQLSPMEIAEKLEYLLSEYDRHLQLHKMKTTTGMMETVLVTGAELLEDIVKFQWSKAMRLLFSIQKNKLDLLEAEMQAPGKEVAFIAKARETLGQS